MKKLGNISKIFKHNFILPPLIKYPTTFLYFLCFYVARLNWVNQSDTYKLVNKLKEEAIHDDITFPSKFDSEVENYYKTLPIMY